MVTLQRVFCPLLLFLLIGCTYHTYHYSFSLFGNDEEDLKYDDDDILFRFVPTPEYIWVSIQNRTNSDILLNMNKAEYIDVWGESHHLLFGWSYANALKDFINNNFFVNPVRISSGSTIEGYLWINIWLRFDIGDYWSTVTDTEMEFMDHHMLPKHASPGKESELKDSLFLLTLPVRFDGFMRNYDFTFMIDDVEVVDLK